MKQENPAGSAEFRLEKCNLHAKVLLGNWKQRLKDCCKPGSWEGKKMVCKVGSSV
jgi:hypothetical protein